MSIKQSIAALVILLSVSFSAFSSSYVKMQVHNLQPFVYSDSANDAKASAVGQCFYHTTYPWQSYILTGYSGGQATATVFFDSTSCSGKSESGKYLDYRFFSFSCPDGQHFNPDTEQCELPKKNCEELKAKDAPSPGFTPEDGQPLTATRYYCETSRMCEAKQSYFASGGDLVKESYYTGNECVGSADDYTNDPYYPPITQPDDPDVTDPTHDPDDPTGGDIEDPSVLPDSDSDVVVPKPPTDEPDVEDPPTDESTDTAVVNAITGMNKDVNKALNDMSIDINQASADVQNQIIALNASAVTNTQAIQKQQANDNEIYRKTKALIQQANADITTAVNQNTNAINGVGDDVEKIAGAMDGIAEDVAGISDTLDGIANTDTSGAGIGGTCIEMGTCTGFYESKYPEGLGGLVSGQLNDLKVNTIDNFVSSFGNLDLSNAQRPSFVLPVPFFGDFSFEEHISFDWVFGFVRAVLIMTSIFAARRIIFGG
ncbi:methyl-accepting chemotaxis protein [Vibrio parahaemolyticus]|uniref:methyl-accepting chemotaxis protein n=1 Tax=Vibrio parahaemolyticus TaxID=670 RepID=UPI002B1FFDDA|nr:methyl-accepting chemotaxis protein [Vibrio parahaemolyticus]MEA5244351.1 methyl-accepting chemotaxis protein [Vibrio parahaemolyticus]